MMIKHTVQEHVNSGETIPNGYSCGYMTAPKEQGLYTLYELADEHNCHQGWKWEKEAAE